MTALQDFQNRILKNHKHFSKWAKRQGIEAYRIYDRDIPQFPIAIDKYGPYLHVAEYDTAWEQTPEEHQAWVEMVKNSLVETLTLPYDHIAFKLRVRQKGHAQYEKVSDQGQDFVIKEYGRLFWVNVYNYLDTGLFLDHRPTRYKIGELASGKRVLNLFAYTGSFSVYAATGGARETVTVDLSNTYLTWAKRNFELNAIDLAHHKLIRADVFRFLEEACAFQERFDLIVMDPPSFSNSSKMLETLDVQRDHTVLIHQCLELLVPEGQLFFSTNLKSFKLDPSLAVLAKNSSHESIPEDFRNKKIHQCFMFRK